MRLLFKARTGQSKQWVWLAVHVRHGDHVCKGSCLHHELHRRRRGRHILLLLCVVAPPGQHEAQLARRHLGASQQASTRRRVSRASTALLSRSTSFARRCGAVVSVGTRRAGQGPVPPRSSARRLRRAWRGGPRRTRTATGQTRALQRCLSAPAPRQQPLQCWQMPTSWKETPRCIVSARGCRYVDAVRATVLRRIVAAGRE